MLFNSNIKLLLVLLLAVVLIHMLNPKEAIQNEGEVETFEDDNEIENNIINEGDSIIDDTNNVEESIQNTNVDDVQDVLGDDDNMIDSVLNSDVKPNDLQQVNNANIEENNTSVTAQNMQKLMNENEKNKLKFNSSELLPKEVNDNWFETDFSNAEVNMDDNNLVVTDRYIVGVNTVGQSLKNPSYDLRAAPACPKFTVSPWQQSTIEPDFNIKSMMS